MKVLLFWAFLWSPSAAYHDDIGFRLGVCQYQVRVLDLGYETVVAVKWRCPWNE